jgi:putative sterol carrier protein
MPAWLSEDWLAASNDVVGLVAADLSMTIQVTVSGLAGGDVRYHRIFDGGRAVGAAMGAAPDPHVALTAPADQARAMARAELDPSVAFMRGQLKTVGDPAAVLALLAGWSSQAGLDARLAVAALSDV